MATTPLPANPPNVPANPVPMFACELVTLGGGAGVDWVPTVSGVTCTRGVALGTAGILKVDMANGQTGVLIPSGALAAGTIHPLAVTKIYSTADGTTAASVVAFY